MPRSTLEQSDTVVSILSRLFECKLASLPDEVLHSFSKFEQTGDYRRRENCFRLKKQNTKIKLKKKTDGSASKRKTKCISYLEEKCRNSILRIVKSIRISFQLAEDILEKIEDLKIIHIIRDPRAILQSRSHISDFLPEAFSPNARSLCRRMREDIGAVQRVHILHPNRVFPLRYECLAQYPESVLRNLYDDMSIKYISKTDKWIQAYAKGATKSPQNYSIDHDSRQNVTTASQQIETSEIEHSRTGFDVFKTNSSEISRAWRVKMAPNQVLFVDKLCADVYKTIGVQVFKSRLQLTNVNISEWYITPYTARYCSNR